MTERERRRQLGAWATPPALVAHLLDQVLDPVLASRPSPAGLRVLDPACGDGRFLVAAAERIVSRYRCGWDVATAAVHGVDIDAAAVAQARAALGPCADLRVDDALTATWPASFDAVVGNPPYLNQLARRTSRGGRSPHGGGAYADTAAVFLALALDLARPDGGRVGLVLPQSVLAAGHAAPIRCAAVAGAALDTLWWSGVEMFDAAVLTCIPTFVRGGEQDAVRRWRGPAFDAIADAAAGDLSARPTWAHLVADAAGLPIVALATTRTLGDVATATADFRDQYYGIAPFVADAGDGPPLVTAGLIDVGHSAWGERPARFAKASFAAPRVDVAGLAAADARLGAWARSRLVPKVLVATQTAVLEAVVDEHGAWLPSVPVVTVMPHRPEDLWRVGAVLGAPAASAWAAATYFGAGLGRALKLSAAQVLTIPVPDDTDPAWARAAQRLRAGDVDACALAMDDAYGTDLFGWWAGRQRRPATRC